MKKLFFGILCIVCFGLTSCGDDNDCTTCKATLLGIESTVEVCEDGDDLSVTSSALGISDTETVSGTSKDNYVAGLEAGGYSCN